MTSRADAKEVKAVGYASEAVSSRHSLLQFPREALANFDHLRTLGADEVMVVAVTALAYKFVSGDAVTEINPVRDIRFLKHPH